METPVNPKISAGELAGALQCASGFQDRVRHGSVRRRPTVADFNYRTAVAYYQNDHVFGGDKLREWIRAMYRTAQPLRPFRGKSAAAASAIVTAETACLELQRKVQDWSGSRPADPQDVSYDAFGSLSVASKMLYQHYDERSENRMWLAIAEPERQQPDALPYLKAATRIGTMMRSLIHGWPVMPTIKCAVFTVRADGEVLRAELDPSKCYNISGAALSEAQDALALPDGVTSERPGTSLCRSCRRAKDGSCTYALELPPDQVPGTEGGTQ